MTLLPRSHWETGMPELGVCEMMGFLVWRSNNKDLSCWHETLVQNVRGNCC
jgi:hypothetical protein